jgi:thymidine kinase
LNGCADISCYSQSRMKKNKQLGSIELICGSMFSGKTEEFIRRVKRAVIAKQKIVLFKPKIDNRNEANHIISHDGTRLESIVVTKTSDIVDAIKNTSYDVIGIDEIQFFDQHIVYLCNKLADEGVRVILAWLDLDSKGRPFGPMPNLMAIADTVVKLHAICTKCGSHAHYSYRMSPIDKQVLVAGSDVYMALCRNCYGETGGGNINK